jgi:hypothetical protein
MEQRCGLASNFGMERSVADVIMAHCLWWLRQMKDCRLLKQMLFVELEKK